MPVRLHLAEGCPSGSDRHGAELCSLLSILAARPSGRDRHGAKLCSLLAFVSRSGFPEGPGLDREHLLRLFEGHELAAHERAAQLLHLGHGEFSMSLTDG